ncbi:MAG: GAF domain-containing sensor histidine kinase [Candidatus Thermoplasmatota archaeon]|nr:GAF domain-containing sensor histidine kinase [Candidatus Thermoplasmatota archaeon]
MQANLLGRTLELATAIMNTRDVDTILKLIVDDITDEFGFEACDAFILDEEHDNFVLKISKGFPTDVSSKVEGLAKSRESIEGDLSTAQKIGNLTYVWKGDPSTNGRDYYSILHPERVKLPREGPDAWHELDVLYVILQDADGNMIGLLEPDGPRAGKLLSPQEIARLEMFAKLASIGISNAKLVGTLNRTVKLFRALLDTTVAMQQPVDLKETLKTIAEKLNELVPFDEVSVYLVDWNKNLLIPAYATGSYADEVLADIGPISGLAGEVAKTGKVEIVEDSMDDQRVEEIPGIEDVEVHQTIMAIPLKGKRRVEGVLELYRDMSRKFTGVEYAVVEPFAAHAAIALENARLRDELKLNFDQVQKAYQDVKDMDKMKDSLVDTISHELRTPLTTILGYLEMASAGMYGDVNPKMKDKFESILEQVNRINGLISAMLEMSRLQNKTLSLDFEPVNLAMVTKEVVDDLDREIKSKNHTVTVLFGAELPVVQADRLRAHDVIENLVSNAVKYTDPGGKISIGADILGGKVHIWVKDNGVGIADEDHDKLFDRFFLADASLIRADGRVGIGLYTSREIVKRHGGEIWFESKKGVGSTFHVTLPLKKRAT